MATSSDAHLPLRSISLPSRTHPSSVKLEAALNHLKASVPPTLPLGAAETIQVALVALADMYNSIQESIRSPQNERDLQSYRNRDLAEELLDESVTFIDTCDTARDLLLQMKEHVHNFQSALRRRRGDSSIESEVAAYISFRRKAKRALSKPLSALRRTERKCHSLVHLSGETNLSNVAVALKEATSVTVPVFCSVLLFISTAAGRTGSSGLCMSVISKLIPGRSLCAGKGLKMINEAGTVDLALRCLKNKAELERSLGTLCVNIESIEAGLQHCFSCLLQYRVIMLNIITYCYCEKDY